MILLDSTEDSRRQLQETGETTVYVPMEPPVKQRPDGWWEFRHGNTITSWHPSSGPPKEIRNFCPHAQPGERVGLREPWRSVVFFDGEDGPKERYLYGLGESASTMPESACRIFAVVREVGVEKQSSGDQYYDVYCWVWAIRIAKRVEK